MQPLTRGPALRPSDAAAGRFTFNGAPTASTRLCAAEAVEGGVFKA